MRDKLAANLRECTVLLQGADGELGTGFFVAPGLILTCLHVVRAAHTQKQLIQVWWQQQKYTATIDALPTSEVDLALLRINNAPHNHSYVDLSEDVTVGDELYTFGYTRDYQNGEPATFICEGLDGNIPPLLKFKAGQVRSGFSGSPLLNQRTGKICGVVKRSRDVDIDLGGRAVPTSVVFATFPILSKSQKINFDVPSNPFLPLNGRIENPQQFFGRERELSRVFEILNSGSSVAVIGERGTGKSSLLWAICQQAETQLTTPRKPIYLNLNQIYDEKDFYAALCYEIGIEECKGYSLTRALLKQRLLLVLDEIEKMTLKGFSCKLKSQLRGLAEGSDASLRLVIAASTSLNKLFPDSSEIGMTSLFEGLCIEETIDLWNETTIQKFIAHRMSLNQMWFGKEEITQVINASRGYPKEVMQMCHRIYSSYQSKTLV
jgi:hypothetical protein